MNSDEFQILLIDHDWGNLLSAGDVSQIWTNVKACISNIVDVLCPLKWLKIVANKSAWLNSEPTELAKQRDRLFQIFRRSKRTRQDMYDKAVIKRREFNRLSKRARENFFKEQLIYYKSDQEKFWKKVYELVGSTATATVENVFKYRTNNLLNTVDSAEEMNDFFAGIGKRVVHTISYIPYVQLDAKVKDSELSSFTPLTTSSFFKNCI